MYSIEGVKLHMEDVEGYRRIKRDPMAKRRWWADIKRKYNLNGSRQYKIRFVAIVLPSGC